MPVSRFQVRLLGVSGLPKDVYENVLYFDHDGGEEGVADGIAAAYSDNTVDLWGGVNGMQIRAYDPVDGGQPTFQKDYAFNRIGTTAPGEVAICLSYATVDDPEASTARRRGRLYLGPLRASLVDGPRPDADLIERVLDFGELLAQVGFANATTWHMWSTRDATSAKIESIWTDDAWDTQRRRGLAPTARTVRDVQ